MIHQLLKHWRGMLPLLCLLCLSATAEAQTDVSFDVQNGYASQYSPYYGQTVNVTLANKTFTGGEWQGACFPFSATTAQLDAAFGEGKWTLEAYDSYADGVITFKKATAVDAGVPYIIRLTETVKDPVFNGVTFVESIANEDWVKNPINNNLEWRGFYLRKYQYQIYDSNSDQSYTGYIINADGTLANVRTAPWADQGYYGVNASFYGANNQKLTLSLEGYTSGNGEQDPTTIDPNTLAGKIALRKQITNLPTIYLDVPDVTDVTKLSTVLYKNRQTGEAPYHQTAVQVVDGNGHLTEFTETEEFAQIKVRGNSTADPEKKPYRIKFAKKHKHDLLGNGYTKRNWTLLANCFDHSLIRNVLTHEIGKEIGMPFNPGYQFVDLVINGNYRGTYQVSDHVEAGKNRVDVDEDTGWMIEFQGRPDMLDEPAVQESGCPMFSIKNPDTDDYTAEQLDGLKNEMRTWIKQWQTGWSWNVDDFRSFEKGWRAYNDENQLMKFILETEITADYDGYMSVKAYRDGGKLFFGPVWDKDLAYDNITAGDELNNLAFTIGTSTLRYYFYGDGQNNLWHDARFMKKLHDAFHKLYDNDLLVNKMNAKIDELTAYLDESQKLNFEKWGITNTNNGMQKYHAYTEYADYGKQLKEYFPKRMAFLKDKIDAQYNALGGDNIDDSAVEYIFDPAATLADSKIQSYDGTEVNITLKNRKLVGGMWNTFCVPFDATEADMKTALGCDYELREHTGVEGTVMNFNAPETQDVKHGVPYLIRPAANTNELKFNNVMVAFRENGKERTISFDDGQHQFVGNINYIDLATDGTNLFLGPESKLYKATIRNYKQDGIRCYFAVPMGATGAKVNIAGDDMTTNINAINGATVVEQPAMYNTAGQRVTESYKGIVIVEGKKIIKR